MAPKDQVQRSMPSFSLWLILIGLTIGICVLLIHYWKVLNQYQYFVFIGLFLTAIIAGSPIPVPTPCMALTFTLGSSFDPVLIGIIAGTGAAVGSMLVYYTARTGRHFFPNFNISDPASKIYSGSLGKLLRNIRLPGVVDFVNRQVFVGVFLVSIFPSPFLLPALVTMGISRVKAWKVALACWLGQSVLFLILAALGHFGLGSILRYFGVFKIL